MIGLYMKRIMGQKWINGNLFPVAHKLFECFTILWGRRLKA